MNHKVTNTNNPNRVQPEHKKPEKPKELLNTKTLQALGYSKAEIKKCVKAVEVAVTTAIKGYEKGKGVVAGNALNVYVKHKTNGSDVNVLVALDKIKHRPDGKMKSYSIAGITQLETPTKTFPTSIAVPSKLPPMAKPPVFEMKFPTKPQEPGKEPTIVLKAPDKEKVEKEVAKIDEALRKMSRIQFSDSNGTTDLGNIFNKAASEKAEPKVVEPAKPEPKEFEEDD
jgi:hypothetical protein